MIIPKLLGNPRNVTIPPPSKPSDCPAGTVYTRTYDASSGKTTTRCKAEPTSETSCPKGQKFITDTITGRKRCVATDYVAPIVWGPPGKETSAEAAVWITEDGIRKKILIEEDLYLQGRREGWSNERMVQEQRNRDQKTQEIIDVATAVEEEFNPPPSDDSSKWLLFGGIAAGAALLLFFLKRR